jgi:predicted nuclease of predicted toxin-antitoxin system
MKLLLDANISWRLCDPLVEHFGKCFHVNRIGIAIPPSDIMIWNYAKDNDCVIISHDVDFLDLLYAKNYPPRIILLKTGNIDTKTTLKLLIQAKETILEWSGKETGLLEITAKKRMDN